ncbi:hypothetical protein FRB93_005581 [Tulasnella sp. JGI-2019a]|nr:hypothetical protein FRB93_005581 [Tulasnella sp. JGI-2019a]
MSYAISEVSPLEVVIFRGGPNEDVSEFLGAIRRVAVIQGRHSDDEWMVSYTESCLRGYAMGWFDEVSSGVPTMDWKSLRKAFLGRFRIQDSYPAYALPPAAVPQASTVAASRRPMVQKAPLPVTVDDSFGDLRAQGFFKKLIIGNSGTRGFMCGQVMLAIAVPWSWMGSVEHSHRGHTLRSQLFALRRRIDFGQRCLLGCFGHGRVSHPPGPILSRNG